MEYIFDLNIHDEVSHMWTLKVEEHKVKYIHRKFIFHPLIYIATDFDNYDTNHIINEYAYLSPPEHKRELNQIAQIVQRHPDVISINIVDKYLSSSWDTTVQVLEVSLRSYAVKDKVVEDFKKLKLNMYNIDIQSYQYFFMQYQCKPMVPITINCHIMNEIMHVTSNDYASDHIITDECVIDSIEMLESIDAVDYHLPIMKILELVIENNELNDMDSPLIYVKLTLYYYGNINNRKHIEIADSEYRLLQKIEELIEKYDPDILLIPDGDRFVLNYFAYRAKKNKFKFKLDRFGKILAMNRRKGSSFSSYGQAFYRSARRRIYGRVYIDKNNSFFYHDCDLDGIFELSRISGIPPSEVSRSSIGTILTSIQIMINHKNNMLLPPIKAKSENFKPLLNLLQADNGGLIYDVKPGIYFNVWSIDFTSLYPFIMLNHNLGSETVLCTHDECKTQITVKNKPILPYFSEINFKKKKVFSKMPPICDKILSTNIVPDLGYHICTKRISIVTQSMMFILNKRVILKSIRHTSERYTRMDRALKWILVSSFGYLGYKNSRWGSIEAHQSVTAYARRYLMNAKKIASEMGYDVIGGIVDNLFLKAKLPKNDTKKEIRQLMQKIEKKLQIPISCDGRFKWVVFPNIKENKKINALNRYFGYFERGEFKLRGIKSRQKGVTRLELEFQQQLLERLSKVEKLQDFQVLIPILHKMLLKWINKLFIKNIDTRKLIIRIKSSRGYNNFVNNNTLQAIAVNKYHRYGREIHMGESFSFVVVNYNGSGTERVIIGPNVRKNSPYDASYYAKLLERAFLEITETIQIQIFGTVIYTWKKNGKDKILDDFFPKLNIHDVCNLS